MLIGDDEQEDIFEIESLILLVYTLNDLIQTVTKLNLKCKSRCVCGEYYVSYMSLYGELQRQDLDVVKGNLKSLLQCMRIRRFN